MAQVSVCASVKVQWGEGPLSSPTSGFGGYIVGNLERRCSESKAT